MDAISFAASLTALIAVVTTTSKAVYDLHRTLRNAPRNIENLVEQLHTFECLLKEIQTQLQEHRNNALPQEMLSQVWGASVTQMERDMKSLDDLLSKVKPLLKKKSISAKVLLSIRETLSEKEIARYLGKISTHCIMLTSIQMMSCSRKLDQVSENTVRVGDECKADFRRVSSRLLQFTDQVGHENSAGFQMVSSQLTTAEVSSDRRFQTVLGCLNDHIQSGNTNLTKLYEISQQQLRAIDVNEAGFQSVHASLVRANTERDRSTQAILSQLGDQLQQIRGTCVTVESARATTRPPFDSHRAPSVTMKEATLFRKSYPYQFHIGALMLNLTQTQQRTRSKRSSLADFIKSKIEAVSIPPKWLSSFAIRYTVTFDNGFIGNHLRYSMTLHPLTINRNPVFLKAVESGDIEGIKRLFREGLAHPADNILGSYGLVHWTKYTNWNIFGEQLVTRNIEMFNYMIEENLPRQDDFISRFIETGHRYFEYSKQFQDSLHNYLKHGGKIFSGKSSVLRNALLRNQFCSSISWVPGLLSHSAELLMIDDLSSLEICLIGTLASVDTEFQDLLKKHLMSCRSPFRPNSIPTINSLYESIFGTTSIISHLCKLKNREHMDFFEFLELLCRTGSASMIKLFIDNGINFNETSYHGATLLRAAVAGSNTDVVHLLLNTGINAASALATIFSRRIYQRFELDVYDRDLLRLLVDAAKPTLLEEGLDPLEVILVRGAHRSCWEDLDMIATLLARQLFFPRKLLGNSIRQYRLEESYMFLAIYRDLPDVIELLLQTRAEAGARITDLFHVPSELDKVFGSYTWLTVSVIYGRVNCVNALIQHGASVTALDLQIARRQALGPHPRYHGRRIAHPLAFLPRRLNGIRQDLEILAVVEQVFDSTPKDTESPKYYEDPVCALKLDFRSPTGQEIAVSALRDMLRNGLRHILTSHQIEQLRDYLKDLYKTLRRLWRLSFFEALLMRFFYVISYFLLCAVEVYAIARSRKRIPTPSRSLLSAGAVLLLVLLGGSSFFGSTSS